ncbi:C5ORF35 [Salix viminalis]|uniref:C5ORF35 n=1 Tax=Salix viminalis TaxID=40686 RepID=A0A9Q0ZJR8_SALVM|nr:C5ORF35 [Salix viminalis]
MTSLFHKFQEVVKTLAESPTDVTSIRNLKHLFILTSCNRLGRNADKAVAKDISEMANKSYVAELQKKIQENIHFQITNFCTAMNDILLPDARKRRRKEEAPPQSNAFAVGKSGPPTDRHAIPETRQLNHAEVSQSLKDHIGYTLKADAGTVIAIYPGIIYGPAYYQYIPGYPRIHARNPYVITRHDGTVINAQPWGFGGEIREVWDGVTVPEITPNVQSTGKDGPELVWRVLSKPLEGIGVGDVLERRNPLALAHFANQAAQGIHQNVMACPYDFPLTEIDLRTYIPNVSFANPEVVNTRRFGSFWFSAKNSESNVPVLKTLVLVAARALCDEEVLVDYKSTNMKC